MTHHLALHRPDCTPAPGASSSAAGLLVAVGASRRSAQPRSSPTIRSRASPRAQDASGAQPWDIDLFYDLTYNLFVDAAARCRRTPARGNINTIDEVPDSSWFTNRIGTRALTADELMRGPVAGPPPDPAKWTIIREKTAGAAPGFTAQDANGRDVVRLVRSAVATPKARPPPS